MKKQTNKPPKAAPRSLDPMALFAEVQEGGGEEEEEEEEEEGIHTAF